MSAEDDKFAEALAHRSLAEILQTARTLLEPIKSLNSLPISDQIALSNAIAKIIEVSMKEGQRITMEILDHSINDC